LLKRLRRIASRLHSGDVIKDGLRAHAADGKRRRVATMLIFVEGHAL
jgi:hypothetical protein